MRMYTREIFKRSLNDGQTLHFERVNTAVKNTLVIFRCNHAVRRTYIYTYIYITQMRECNLEWYKNDRRWE